jgi:hypothetical protein
MTAVTHIKVTLVAQVTSEDSPTDALKDLNTSMVPNSSRSCLWVNPAPVKLQSRKSQGCQKNLLFVPVNT